MNRHEVQRELTKLFEQAEQAHRAAHGEPRDNDVEWALFYAQYLKDRVTALLGRTSPCVELVRLILDAEEEHQLRSPDTPWAEFYAAQVVDRCVAESNEALALYYYPTCFYCRRVTSVIDELGIEVELRDILREPKYREELLGARGRTTVPVLRCTDKSGHDRWMPESRDIVAFLQRRFG